MIKEVYTVKEIAEKYSLSRTTAYTYVRSLPPNLVLRFGKCLRVDKQGFEEYLRQTSAQQYQEEYLGQSYGQQYMDPYGVQYAQYQGKPQGLYQEPCAQYPLQYPQRQTQDCQAQ